ncbi:hypothetical protein [Bradyrhizobium sp. STM 3557]|uniref:hypothetical protein n=1 Tax=Bradyrhizobium sp. STM 3557 TaxID=578920 RepID=UPI00388DB333
MFRALFELLFWAPAEGASHVAMHAWQRNATHSEREPYERKSRFDDPVYKQNVQRLIERSRKFEEARE